jgi:hypothetical protein
MPTFSKENLSKYKRVYRAVGPLRFQMASADCVPATVVNALLYATKKNLPPILMRLIWAGSMDQSKGTGWVCSKLLGDLLESWFTLSKWDGEQKETLSDFTSKVKCDKKLTLNTLVRTLNAGGVACLTTNSGRHYELLHSHRDGQTFYGFDPTWQKDTSLKLLEETYGMVNIEWSREELIELFEDERNQFVHLIKPRARSETKPLTGTS